MASSADRCAAPALRQCKHGYTPSSLVYPGVQPFLPNTKACAPPVSAKPRITQQRWRWRCRRGLPPPPVLGNRAWRAKVHTALARPKPRQVRPCCSRGAVQLTCGSWDQTAHGLKVPRVCRRGPKLRPGPALQQPWHSCRPHGSAACRPSRHIHSARRASEHQPLLQPSKKSAYPAGLKSSRNPATHAHAGL